MAPHDAPRLSIKRPTFSDQQRRREVALSRQAQQRADSQNRARLLASSVLSLPPPEPDETAESDLPQEAAGPRDLNAAQAARLRGPEARKWFARQLMLPEWMVDVPPTLHGDWYVCARPAGKRCFVVSSNGTTVSRLRNGSILHHFPSSLPNGARTKDVSGPAHSYSILDCIFHETDKTYYVIDMVCWRGYSLYECSAEFRFFWLNSKLAETGACEHPSLYHRYRFCPVPMYDSNQMGLHTAYNSEMPYSKDGLLFYYKHAHYQAGITPLVLVWKDQHCSQYLLDTDDKGHVPSQQQVGSNWHRSSSLLLRILTKFSRGRGRERCRVLRNETSVALELHEDGKLVTSDDPPVVFGHLGGDLLQQFGAKCGTLLRFAIGNGGFRINDGKFEGADLEYIGKVNRQRAFADSYSKVLFQYTARHSPLRFEDLLAPAIPSVGQEIDVKDIEMSC